MTPTPKATGIKRLINACGYSIEGLKATFRDEAAFRQEVITSLVLIPLAFVIAPNHMALLFMVASLFVIMIIELLNSAIEAAIDRHGPEKHPLAKKAKDAGSAAVLVAIILAALIWGVVVFG